MKAKERAAAKNEGKGSGRKMTYAACVFVCVYAFMYMMNEKGVMMRKKVMLERQEEKKMWKKCKPSCVHVVF